MSELKLMTQESYDDFVALGCPPLCHACDAQIRVGDEWGLSDHISLDGHYLGPGYAPRRRVRAMLCAPCVVTGCAPSAEKVKREIERALAAKGLHIDDFRAGSTETISGGGVGGGGSYFLEVNGA